MFKKHVKDIVVDPFKLNDFPYQSLLGASKGALQSILKTNFSIPKSEKSSKKDEQAEAEATTVETKETADAMNNTKKLNERNWQYLAKWLEINKD